MATDGEVCEKGEGRNVTGEAKSEKLLWGPNNDTVFVLHLAVLLALIDNIILTYGMRVIVRTRM